MCISHQPLLPFGLDCVLARLTRRTKRFTIECTIDGRESLAHTNNSGGMLGLTRPGYGLLLSPAPGTGRKLPYTLELVCLDPPATEFDARPALPLPPGTWVGVNTLTANRLLRAAFLAKRLPWALGYTDFRPEATRGACRLDALLTGPGLPPLWVECKNVTLVEDGCAAFPDAVTERGRKHVREMMDIARNGERAAFFYCIQRKDGYCFGPADYVDSAYAEVYRDALTVGVEVHPHLALASAYGIDLGAELPLAPGL